MSFDITSCRLCPRLCGANRRVGPGFCGGGDAPRLAKAMLHMWEEPCISGTRGSGAVFFSGCPLHCVYCQNSVISRDNFGEPVTVRRLAHIFLELAEQGAHNINLVSPTQYIPWIIEALELVRPQLTIPVVYNTGGYERVESLRTLEGLVDIYLPDLKYRDSELSLRYSGAPDYFERATAAIDEMVRQTGAPRLDDEGLLQRGTLLRHLVLPGCRRDSLGVVQYIGERWGNQILLSLMSQYTPQFYTGGEKALTRRLTTFEYKQVLELACDLGLSGFMQERSSAKTEYTPNFDLSGILPI